MVINSITDDEVSDEEFEIIKNEFYNNELLTNGMMHWFGAWESTGE